MLAATNDVGAWLTAIWTIAQVALGLGFVIFVHELGHFAVAKMCGVKCEKFYLGFDIGGLKLAKYQWGETEYGIGILPLGGYVKMLGQDDNPGNAADERERSTLDEGKGEAPAKLDPRSYMAKSVPQRMAIISAGVIMNVIFAVLMAALAYGLGVPDSPCSLGGVIPGGAAWRANLQPGDQIVRINGFPAPDDPHAEPLRFRDLMHAVALGDPEKGVDFTIVRDPALFPDEKGPIDVHIQPDRADPKSRLAPFIGAMNNHSLELYEREKLSDRVPAVMDLLGAGGRITAVDGKTVRSYAELQAQLAARPDDTLELTVETVLDSAKSVGGRLPVSASRTVKIPPRKRVTLGLVMKHGKIVNIQKDSPAEQAGFLPNDFITLIDGSPATELDPLELPDRFRRLAGRSVKVSVQRSSPNAQDAAVELTVTPRLPRAFESPVYDGDPLTIPALGLSMKVLNVVRETQPGSPAALAKVEGADGKPATNDKLVDGDELIGATLTFPTPNAPGAAAKQPVDIKFSDDVSNWPALCARMQEIEPGTTVRLKLRGDRTVALKPAEAEDWFVADRGILLKPLEQTYQASSFAGAMKFGFTETGSAMGQVFKMLRRVSSGDVSPRAIGGVPTIAMAAYAAASRGFSTLLIMLTMLSANLAVINFLPIPILDGGHMVFLAYEGIFGKPANERVTVLLHYLGLIFILGLMLFAFGLDFGVIPRFAN